MKIEIGDNAGTLLQGVIVCAGIVAVILGISWFIYDSNNRSRDAITHAKSCEEMVILQNPQNLSHQLLLCKLNPSAVTQSGK